MKKQQTNLGREIIANKESFAISRGKTAIDPSSSNKLEKGLKLAKLRTDNIDIDDVDD